MKVLLNRPSRIGSMEPMERATVLMASIATATKRLDLNGIATVAANLGQLAIVEDTIWTLVEDVDAEWTRHGGRPITSYVIGE